VGKVENALKGQLIFERCDAEVEDMVKNAQKEKGWG